MIDPNNPSRLEVRSYFVRERNALLTRANFEPLYVDHYLHLMENKQQIDSGLDTIYKEALGAFVLCLASRPLADVSSWTLSFQDPQFNVFVTGDSTQEIVIGRVFTENIKPRQRNLMVSQVRDPVTEVRQSMVEFDGTGIFAMVETFYKQSEQRPARLFRYAEEEFVCVTAQPDCDLEWLQGLDDAAIRSLDQREALSLLETRYYQYRCGCSLERLFPTFASFSNDALDELYQEDEVLKIQCPRCGIRYAMTREALEAFLHNKT